MGISLRKIKRIDKSSTLVSYKENIEFNNIDTDDYLEKFNLLLKNKKIIECNYYDYKWILLNQDGTYTIDFKDISKNINIISAMKVYVIILLLNNIVAGSIRSHIDSIKDIIGFSCDLDTSKFEEFKDKLDEMFYNDPFDYRLYNIVSLGVKFLKFYNNKAMIEFIDCIRYYNVKRSIENRELPSFESALWFDSILNDFYNKSSEEEKKRYYILFLWWFITSLIPMRPCEFLEIRKDCIRIDNDKYYLKVPKRKEKRKSINTDQKFREVRITKSLYFLIYDYKKYNMNENSSDFLFNYDDYRETFHKNRNSNRILREYYDNKIGSYRFKARLDDFYNEIVEKKYDIKTITVDNDTNINGGLVIERIRPGDTRHFAICNLYLQGHNPLTIARLAGHESLNTQLSYANHMKFFAQSNVKVLTDMIRRNKVFDDNIRNSNFFNDNIRKNIINKNKGNEFYRIVDGVKCSDKEFPINCISHCENCIYKIEDDKNKYVYTSNKYNNEINKQIDIMTNIIKKTQLGTLVERNRNFDIEEQRIFSSASKKLQTAIYKKAITDYNILEKEYIE